MGTAGQTYEETLHAGEVRLICLVGTSTLLPSLSEVHSAPSAAMFALAVSLHWCYPFRKGARQSTQTRIAFCACGYSCFTSSQSEFEIVLLHDTTSLALKSWFKCWQWCVLNVMTSLWMCLDSYQQETKSFPAQIPLEQSDTELWLIDVSYSLVIINYTYCLFIPSFYWGDSQNFAAP